MDDEKLQELDFAEAFKFIFASKLKTLLFRRRIASGTNMIG
jgi:hypothetical protein